MATEKRLDLIDRQALGIGRCNPDVFPIENREYCAGWNGVISVIEKAPAVDAVEVVRCKDCKFWIAEDLERCKAMKADPYGLCNRYPERTDWQDTKDYDDFCSYGERRIPDGGSTL